MDNKLIQTEQNIMMNDFTKTNGILHDMQEIIERTRESAYQAVNLALIKRNRLIGYRIAEEGLGGEGRAEYEENITQKLLKELSNEYGKGFTKLNLYNFYPFYKTYPHIFQTASGKSALHLSWSHYAVLLQVQDNQARN